MGVERRDYVYGDKTYSLLLPIVTQSMTLCNRVAILVGPILGTLNKDVEQDGLGKFSNALKSIDPATIDSLFMDSIRMAKLVCENNPIFSPIEFEKHFSQYRADVYPVCVWCLWECVKDFFPQLGTFAQKAKEAAEKAFQSQMGG